jgi:hypothetical protein
MTPMLLIKGLDTLRQLSFGSSFQIALLQVTSKKLKNTSSENIRQMEGSEV